MITQEKLKELIYYKPSHGTVTFLTKRAPMKPNAYAINIVGVSYPIKKLIHLYMTGEMPKHPVTPLNGIESDNRWVNLAQLPLR